MTPELYAEALIRDWHIAVDVKETIYEYMKLSWEEYQLFLTTDALPDDFLSRHE